MPAAMRKKCMAGNEHELKEYQENQEKPFDQAEELDGEAVRTFAGCRAVAGAQAAETDGVEITVPTCACARGRSARRPYGVA
jgi:hypothetical protein